MNRTVIIGAGVTGLTCAYLLRQQGRDVVIFDPSEPGGVVRTLRQQGFILEQGPNVLVAKEHLCALLRTLGLEQEMVAPRTKRYSQLIFTGGRAHPAPRGFLPFIKSSLIAPRDKLSILRTVFWGGAASREDCSVRDFFLPLLGHSTVDTVLETVLKGVWGGDISRLRASALFPELVAHLRAGRPLLSYMRGRPRPSIFVLRRGMAQLIEALLAALPHGALRKERVVAIRRDEMRNGFEVQLESGERAEADRVIVATAAGAAAGFVEPLDAELSRQLSAVRCAPLVVAHWSVSRAAPVPRDSFGVLFNGVRDDGVLGIMFNAELFPHLAPHDTQLLTVCFGGISAPGICALSEAELRSRCVKMFEAEFGIAGVTPLAIQRWSHAIPQYEEGYAALVSQMRGVEQRFPGLYFAGADHAGAGVPDRVRRAFEVTQYE